MYEKIKYDRPFGFGTFEHFLTAELGDAAWAEITRGIELPDIKIEAADGCKRMAAFMERLEANADFMKVRRALKNVRHGLHPSQAAWAREELLKIGDLDEYIARNISEGIENFQRMCDNDEDFYGQIVTPRVVDYIKAHPACLSAVREGNKLFIEAFPAQMDEYILTNDARMKRYYACHCPFAKESILTDKPVSATLCNCSLGHVSNLWEAMFERELRGEVVASALAGDLYCKYMIILDDDIMKEFVKE